MKKENINPLPFVKEFVDYFIRRAKRVLRLKEKEFKSTSIDISSERGTIWVWFHTSEEVIGRAQFNFDGKCYYKCDNRNGKK